MGWKRRPTYRRLIFRTVDWQEEANLIQRQQLPTRLPKILKHLDERAYLWINYPVFHPTPHFQLPSERNDHWFLKFRYDKLGTKPMSICLWHHLLSATSVPPGHGR